MCDQQIVTISFSQYRSARQRWWAFQQMGRAPRTLVNIPGLQFVKMLGSGAGNGFSIWPNWGVYGLLGVWDKEESAQHFLDKHPIFQSIQNKAENTWTVFMRAFMAHGAWDGVSPFAINGKKEKGKPIGVITRATIRTRQLWRFWRFVPPVSRSVDNREGLLFSVGIGELPLVQQATFSLWENEDRMKAYAYQSKHHKEVVKRTRELGWYKEELFARFVPYKTAGNWDGKDPLEPYLCGE